MGVSFTPDYVTAVQESNTNNITFTYSHETQVWCNKEYVFEFKTTHEWVILRKVNFLTVSGTNNERYAITFK